MPQSLNALFFAQVTCLQFFGNRIVSGSDDNTLRIWSASTGKVQCSVAGVCICNVWRHSYILCLAAFKNFAGSHRRCLVLSV